jgi:hypothetical protein
MKFKLFLIVSFVSAAIFAPKSVLALEQNIELVIPTFPVCSQPQGTTKVVYSNGIHGIPGRTQTYTGKDAVYNLTEETLTQCFCSVNDDGIQTNWWKVSSLSIADIEYLQSIGWTYIPNGALWGLEEAPYVANNVDYDCGTHKDDDDDDDNDDNDNDDDDEEDEGNRGGILLGYATQRLRTGGEVLGLASTGDLLQLVGVFTAAGAVTATGAYILKKNKQKDN